MSIPYPRDAVHYPEEDGEPMAEGDIQRDYLIYAVESLREYFRKRADVYVSGNLFVYYEEGNPKAVVAPDCFVVFGVPNHNRRIYKVWEEAGKVPAFVFEVTSKTTRCEDQGPKRGLYAFLGVTEYWQYDPTGSYLSPPLQGFRLEGANYVPVERSHPFGTDYYLPSETLGLEMHLRNGELRFRDPESGRFLLSRSEAETSRHKAEAAKREAERQARAEMERRQAAEARIAELEAQLRALGD